MQPTNGEVTIICLTDEVNLKDLGIRLTRGARVEVPMSAAMRSRDLSRAKVDGTVSTQTLRASAIRVSEYASSDTTTSQSPRFQPPVPAPPQVDLAPLLGVVEALTAEVKSLRAEVASLKQPQAPVVHLDTQKIIDALSGSQAQEALRQPVVTLPSDVPVFIPEHIVGSGLKPTLDVKAQRGDAHGVEDAARALKSARKNDGRSRGR